MRIVVAVAAALIVAGFVPFPAARDAAETAWSGVSGVAVSVFHAIQQEES